MSRPADARRPWRYLLAGGFTTVVSYGSYALGTALGLNLPLASAIGLLMGIAVGFVLQGRFTFRYRGSGALPRYLLTWAAMYGLHLGIVSALRHQDIDPYTAGLAALAVITVISYFVQRDLVFRATAAQTKSR